MEILVTYFEKIFLWGRVLISRRNGVIRFAV